MPTYKLNYFNSRGKAEIPRQIFALAGQEYEDHRFTQEDWATEVKPHTPFGQCPVLEVDGKQLAQSHAIARYLAKTFGFAGQCDWESAQIDALADQYNDFMSEMRPYFRVVAGFQEGDREQLYNDVGLPGIKKFFGILTSYLKENKSGFLVGDKVSWVDLLIAEMVNTFQIYVKDVADPYPEVQAHKEKVRSIPALHKWLEVRPETKF